MAARCKTGVQFPVHARIFIFVTTFKMFTLAVEACPVFCPVYAKDYFLIDQEIGR
jgi:hypothetical protein